MNTRIKYTKYENLLITDPFMNVKGDRYQARIYLNNENRYTAQVIKYSNLDVVDSKDFDSLLLSKRFIRSIFIDLQIPFYTEVRNAFEVV